VNKEKPSLAPGFPVANSSINPAVARAGAWSEKTATLVGSGMLDACSNGGKPQVTK